MCGQHSDGVREARDRGEPGSRERTGWLAKKDGAAFMRLLLTQTRRRPTSITIDLLTDTMPQEHLIDSVFGIAVGSQVIGCAVGNGLDIMKLRSKRLLCHIQSPFQEQFRLPNL